MSGFFDYIPIVVVILFVVGITSVVVYERIRTKNIANGWIKHNTHAFFMFTPSVVVIMPILKLENMNMPIAT